MEEQDAPMLMAMIRLVIGGLDPKSGKLYLETLLHLAEAEDHTGRHANALTTLRHLLEDADAVTASLGADGDKAAVEALLEKVRNLRVGPHRR